MTGARKSDLIAAERAADDLAAGSFEANAKWPVLQDLKLPLRVRVPMRRMTLGAVRELAVGAIVESEWPAAEEVRLDVADVALSWCEFAVIDGVMAARLTRLG